MSFETPEEIIKGLLEHLRLCSCSTPKNKRPALYSNPFLENHEGKYTCDQCRRRDDWQSDPIGQAPIARAALQYLKSKGF